MYMATLNEVIKMEETMPIPEEEIIPTEEAAAEEAAPQPDPVQPEIPAPKGSLWPPVLIMGILTLLGLALFFFL